MPYYQIAFPNFTQELVYYKVQANTSCLIGYRVEVPFGKKQCIGIVIQKTTDCPLDPTKIKPVKQALDEFPILNTYTIKFLKQIANYYQLPINTLVGLAINQAVRTAPIQFKKQWLKANSEKKPKTKTQIEIYNACLNSANYWELYAQYTAKTLNKMIDENYLSAAQESIKQTTPNLIELSSEQTKVLDNIKSSFIGTHLIWGVTGSGKTEIYTHLIQHVLSQKKHALILVPEIALTSQTANKIALRTGVTPFVIHSQLTPKQRIANTMLIQTTQQPMIILGTRSVLLTNLVNLGIIIIDEEHDDSFRHNSQLFFSARDMAVLKAHQEKIPVILGSATPSLESIHNATSGKYDLHHINHRIHTTLPNIYLIQHQSKQLFSDQALEKINHTLDTKKDVLIFVSRRGWANVRLCLSCNWKARCSSCQALLVAHQDDHLHCHRCRTKIPAPLDCPQCKQSELVQFGYGTQQVASEAEKIWPTNPVYRFDTDQTPSTINQQFKQLEQTTGNIIIGTQMLTKGHDFSKTQMVVCIQADQGLYTDDFRAEENLLAELTQVAGRCGRRQLTGNVYIQAKNPNHPLFQALTQPKNQYTQSLLDMRKQYGLPPYTFLAAIFIRISAKDIPHINQLTLNDYPGCSVLGPIPFPSGNRNHKLCYQITCIAESRQTRANALLSYRTLCQAHAKSNWEISWQIDSHFAQS
ncbi:primosomal protein N' [Candidatus Comchoanobacter bicostacola]|uniref:Replication restart protein PriA n=1 Tax=Candidatus Comchoanobacter bicostacola TaxID=2919598 RepID=A0ABY5DJW8_9GAMM|nr:primosomal protein N' [Candidatus Comchoanobacter bicostacola]UTC24584.1 primosomal protein N' [Candidatus Comchoanobacter bicostacola]